MWAAIGLMFRVSLARSRAPASAPRLASVHPVALTAKTGGPRRRSLAATGQSLIADS